jgi:hypothetical protein
MVKPGAFVAVLAAHAQCLSETSVEVSDRYFVNACCVWRLELNG